MTLKEIKALNKDFLTVQEVAGCIRCDPQLIRDEAVKNPKFLGFPITKIGHSWKIPKDGFVRWASGMMPIVKWPYTYEQMRDEMRRMMKDGGAE